MRPALLWVLAACAGGGPDEPDGTATGDTGTPATSPPVADCPAVAPPCTTGCAAGPSELAHADWFPRLTESPPLSWTPAVGAVRHEVAVGTAPGLDDVACWTEASADDAHQFLSLWTLTDGETYYASVRGIGADGVATDVISSDGWTVDILPPATPEAVDDTRAPVDGTVSWTHDGTDNASGFVGYELAVGTAPGLDDVQPWADVGPDPTATIDTSGLASEQWFWVSARAVDVAGNRSPYAVSEGFITCPTGFVFVPGDVVQNTTPFCVAAYEMRAVGLADGNVPYDPALVAESRADGTPWVNLDKSQARVECDALAFGYQLISNAQWQTIAHSIERTASNWSDGAVGMGFVNRGHTDAEPATTLASDGDPCVGTGQPTCTDPSSPDFRQRRTHALANGEVIWDFAGNAWEQVDGSVGGPEGLWMDYDSDPFTVDPGWEDHAKHFAPSGPYATAEGMGRMYGGSGNLVRGGSYSPASPGSAGSDGADDYGIYAAHHNNWQVDASDGFRCVFWPM